MKITLTGQGAPTTLVAHIYFVHDCSVCEAGTSRKLRAHKMEITCDTVQQHLDCEIGNGVAYTVSSREEYGQHQNESIKVDHYVASPYLTAENKAERARNRLPGSSAAIGASRAASLFASVNIIGTLNSNPNSSTATAKSKQSKDESSS